MRALYQLIKDYIAAGLLMEFWQTSLPPDDGEFTFVINDKPQQDTAKLHHSNRSNIQAVHLRLDIGHRRGPASKKGL